MSPQSHCLEMGIKTKAAVAWSAKSPLEMVELDLEDPKRDEVLVRIVATGICHTDLYTLGGKDPEGVFPAVLGHEGVGYVEALGENCGDEFLVGDLVIPLYTAECRTCKMCTSGKTNLCSAVRATQGRGVMPDGTSRFSYQGKPVYHFMGVSSFSNYTVVSRHSLVKVSVPLARVKLPHLCLLGCGVTTGIGAALNNVEEGTRHCAIFGMGVIGLSVLIGCRMRKVGNIIGIDTNDSKLKLADRFGALDGAINPQNETQDLVNKIVELTDGGADYTFECIGSPAVMRQALEACHKGWGESIIIGVAGGGDEISTRPFQLVTGRVWRGCAFGGVKGKSQLNDYVKWAEEGTIPLSEFVTAEVPIEKINEAFDEMKQGNSLRILLRHE